MKFYYLWHSCENNIVYRTGSLLKLMFEIETKLIPNKIVFAVYFSDKENFGEVFMDHFKSLNHYKLKTPETQTIIDL